MYFYLIRIYYIYNSCCRITIVYCTPTANPKLADACLKMKNLSVVAYILALCLKCYFSQSWLNDFQNEISIRKKRPLLTVSLSSSSLKNGDFVKVTWSGVENSNKSDQIGLYCPITEDDSKEIRRYTHSKKSRIGRANGEIMVDVYYPRTTCQFRYLQKNSTGIYESIAASNEISFDYKLDDPMHIHIALTNSHTEMRIMWVSASDLTPCVNFGLNPSSLNETQCGSTSTYSSNDMCEPPASSVGYINPGFLHDVLLHDLTPNTHYYYRVGNKNAHSSVFKFKSAIPSDSSASLLPVKIDVFGDLSVSKFPGAQGTILRIREEINRSSPPDFILHVGDVSYAEGHAYVWEEFGYLIEPVSATIPYMFSIGNHEHDYVRGSDKDPSNDGPNFRPHWGNYFYDSGGECSVPMVYRYHMPDNGNRIFWYSFNYGISHVIQFSTEHNFTVGSNQYRWLENDLKNIDRKITPWVIVTTHRPMYVSTSNLHDSSVTFHIRENIEQLLLKYKVDFFINGHFHFYERTCSIRSHVCIEDNLMEDNWAVVHLIVGAGGKKMEKDSNSQNAWSIYKTLTFGHGEINILNSTFAEWQYIANINGSVIDRAHYYRNHNF